jgi:hypothetical protein
VNTIKSSKPEKARKAMDHHLNKLIAHVDRYWEQVFPNRESR